MESADVPLNYYCTMGMAGKINMPITRGGGGGHLSVSSDRLDEQIIQRHTKCMRDKYRVGPYAYMGINARAANTCYYAQ